MAAISAIDRVFRNAVESGGVPGVVAVAATREGPAYEGAFGRRALPQGPEMTADSVFWIASMTKAITSTAAMQLVERGRLELDAPVAGVLPELANPQVLQCFDAKGEPMLRPARRPITLRHLLTHTAGFGYDIWSPDLVRYQELRGIPGIISCQNLALTVPLIADPGDRWNYGISVDWLGKAVERASGQTLGSYFGDHILGPLGMADTSFKLRPDQRARLVGMHARQADGSLQPMPFEVPQEPEFQMGGGGLYGTAGDYLKFAQVFLHGGAPGGVTIVKPETARLMTENNIGALEVRRLVTAIPAYSNDAEFFPGMVKKWGLGFMIGTGAVSGGRSAGSLTWAGLANTYFWIDPRSGIAGVILAQLVPFADPTVLGLYDSFEKEVYRALA